jgi:putative MATE family efflux protein
MTVGTEWKQIALFTLPIMAGTLLQQLYNIVDGIIVGNVIDSAAFSAVVTGQPLTVLYLALAMGLAVGVNVVISQYFGAGKSDKLPVAINTALLLLGACGLVLTILGVTLSETLLKYLLNVPEDILPDATMYMSIYSVGLFFTFLYNGVAAVLRGFGDSRATLYFLLIASLLSAALTFVFVLVIRWGVAGAAFSTVLSQAACAAVSYMYLRKRYPYEKTGKRWDRDIASTMVKLGIPVAIQMGIVSFGHGAMQRLVNGFEGLVPGVVAAYGAAIRLDMLVYVPIMGFQSGLASFVGQNMGAGRVDRVKRGLRATLVMSLATTVLVSVILYAFAETVIGFFGLSGASLDIGVTVIRYLHLFFWLFASFITVNGLLQGAGDTLIISISTLVALFVRVFTGYMAVYFGWLEVEAAWITMPIGWFFAAVITFSRYFSGAWKKKAVAGKLKRGG